MAKTTTTATTAPSGEPGEYRWVDPRVLTAHTDNLRDDLGGAELDDLAASIAARGVLEPLVIVGGDDDGYRIIAGRRRTAAAIMAGAARVPCIVRDDLADAPDTIISMLVENTHRRSLSVAEEARGHHQLALAGLSAARIAKATTTNPAHVKRSLAVAGSDVATATAGRYDLSLDQALAVAEFADDAEAVKVLVVTATKDPGRFDHLVARLRADRDFDTARQATADRLGEAGIRVVNEEDLGETAERLYRLTGADQTTTLDEEAHTSCPGHVVTISDHDPDRVIAWCDDPAGNGHHDRFARSGGAGPSDRGEDGKLTEKARAERRAVIEGNKAWRAARPVRQDWVRTLLARKTPPKGTLRFCVTMLMTRPERFGDGKDGHLADMLSRPEPEQTWGRTLGPQLVVAAADARLPLVLLAQVAADFEATAMHDHLWRSPTTEAAHWLAWLADTGYQLADIETAVIAAKASPDPGAA